MGRRSRIEVYEDTAGEFRWRLIAANHETVASGESYESEWMAHRAAQDMLDAAEGVDTEPDEAA